jgi:Domain of unknown function (DUF1963)
VAGQAASSEAGSSLGLYSLAMYTPVPPIDVAALVPGLAPYARTATRLHPRRRPVSPDDSHIGGPVRWPADEAWPMCTADLPGPDEIGVPQLDGGFLAVKTPPGIGARPLPHPQPNPMIVVAQLRESDVPGLWHPEDADVLQVLWCPFGHDQDHGHTPTMRFVWRQHDPDQPIAEPPSGLADERFYVPQQCALHPEPVIEYPDLEDLPDELAAQVQALGDHNDYSGQLSTAPGWKVGGWPQWSVAGPAPIDCHQCANAMRLLLTIDSTEHGGDRWQPVGDQGDGTEEARREPTSIVVGRWSSLQIFVCTHCPDHPIRSNLQ